MTGKRWGGTYAATADKLETLCRDLPGILAPDDLDHPDLRRIIRAASDLTARVREGARKTRDKRVGN